MEKLTNRLNEAIDRFLNFGIYKSNDSHSRQVDLLL